MYENPNTLYTVLRGYTQQTLLESDAVRAKATTFYRYSADRKLVTGRERIRKARRKNKK